MACVGDLRSGVLRPAQAQHKAVHGQWQRCISALMSVIEQEGLDFGYESDDCRKVDLWSAGAPRLNLDRIPGMAVPKMVADTL